MKWYQQAAVLVVLSGIAAGALSQYMWGYPIRRPDILSSAQKAIRVEAVITVADWRPENSGTLQRSGDWQDNVELTEKHPYDIPEGRALIAWRDLGILNPDISELPLATAANALAAVKDFFPAGTGVYQELAENRSAIVARFDGAEKKNLLLVAARAGQHRNDHYAYREFVLEPTETGYTVLEQTGFQYDIAGIEGLEFPYLFVIIFVFLAIVTATLNGFKHLVLVLQNKMALNTQG